MAKAKLLNNILIASDLYDLKRRVASILSFLGQNLVILFTANHSTDIIPYRDIGCSLRLV